MWRSVSNYANKVKLGLQARHTDELWKEPKSVMMYRTSHLGLGCLLLTSWWKQNKQNQSQNQKTLSLLKHINCTSLGQVSQPWERNCTLWNGSFIFHLSGHINFCEKGLLISKGDRCSFVMSFRDVEKRFAATQGRALKHVCLWGQDDVSSPCSLLSGPTSSTKWLHVLCYNWLSNTLLYEWTQFTFSERDMPPWIAQRNSAVVECCLIGKNINVGVLIIKNNCCNNYTV